MQRQARRRASDCRVDGGNAGGFRVAAHADGALVAIAGRLELVPPPYDGGPFLTRSERNAETTISC